MTQSAAFLAALPLLLACSKPSTSAKPDGASPGPITSTAAPGCKAYDACTLLTRAELENALGTALEAGKRGENDVAGSASRPEIATCEYGAVALGAPHGGLSVFCGPHATEDAAVVRTALRTAGYEKQTDITGIGDHAVWGVHVVPGDVGGELYVYTGGKKLVVGVHNLPDEKKALELAKRLATTALGRL